MKYLLIFTCIIFQMTPSFAQEDTTYVPIVSYWSLGDVYDFKITKQKQEWDEDQLKKNDSTIYLMNFKVIDSTESSYRIRLTYKNTIENTIKLPQDVIKEISNNNPIKEIIYKTNELGTFEGIENWEEVSKASLKMFDEIIDNLPEMTNSDKTRMKEMMSPMLNVYKSKQGIEMIVLKELAYLHSVFGAEYPLGIPIEYEDLLPNMLGGDPIRGEASIELTEMSEDDYRCKLVQKLKLNEEDTRELITTMFKQMAAAGNISLDVIDELKEDAVFEITDYNTFEYNYDVGIPIKIETKRTTLINIATTKGKRVDKIIIELME